MIYVIIKDQQVNNLVISDDLNILDNAVDVTDLVPRPDIGWKYDGNTFSDPKAVPVGQIIIPIIPQPIILSEASGSMVVRIENNQLFIGCFYFDPIWSKQALIELLNNDAPNVDEVVATKRGVYYGEFFIEWADCQKIQDFLNACGV